MFRSLFSLFMFITLTATASAQFGPFHKAHEIGKNNLGIRHMELVGGYGEKTDNFRVAARWSWFDRGLRNTTWRMNGAIEANYSMFDGTRLDGSESDIRDIGITPVLTFMPDGMGHRMRPFVELGIGAHYLSGKDFSTKSFSTNFQFGDHIGVGLQFGKQHRYRLTYRFQHLSNGGIGNPNPGINFHLLSLGFKL